MRRRLSALHCLRRQGEWVCAQAAADAGNVSWACVENRPCPRPGRVDLEDGRADNARRDRVFRTFSAHFSLEREAQARRVLGGK